MYRKGLAALAVFFVGLLSLVFVAHAATPELTDSLNDANVDYIVSEGDARGAKVMVLSPDNICQVLAEHPDVPVLRVYNGITGEDVTCK